MHCGKFAALIASFLFTAVSHAADEPAMKKEEEPPAQVIRWTGSAYKDGDAFILSAEIFPSKVELHWDGFRGTFVFLDDREIKPPERVKKDYLFKDEATVKAFKTLATEAEQCNPGPLMTMGQGVSTKIIVEAPPGKLVQSLYFFDTPPHLLKANRLRDIAFQIRGNLEEAKAGEVPAEDPLSESIRDLASKLLPSAICLGKLEAAYQTRGELPLAEMEALRAPVPVAQALAFRQRKPVGAERSGKLVEAMEALLADCFGPVHRGRFLAINAGGGEGGILLTVRPGRRTRDMTDLLQECLPLKLGKAERPPVNLSRDLEQVLLRFIAGPALAGNAGAMQGGLVAAETFRLHFSEQGNLDLAFTFEGSFAAHTHLEYKLEEALEQPELRARLEYLNSKGIVRFLLAAEAEQGKRPAVVDISELSLYNKEGKNRAHFEFDLNGTSMTVEADLIEGRWVPMRILTSAEYRVREER